MRIVVSEPHGERAVEVVRTAAGATVGDLAAALGLEDSGGLAIDGRVCPSDHELADSPLCEGVMVRTPGPASPVVGEVRSGGPDTERAAPNDLELHVVAGPGSGRTFPFPPGELVVGRSADADVRLEHPSVARRHAMVRRHPDGRVDVCDLGSRTGTWSDGRTRTGVVPLEDGAEVRLGVFVLAVRRSCRDDRPTAIDPVRQRQANGTIPFNRPPRPAPPAAPSALPAPRPPVPGAARPTLALVSILLPAALAIVLVAVTGNVLFALMVGLSPVMAVGTWWSSRRASSRSGRRELVRYRRELVELGAAVEAASVIELARRRAVVPDVAEVVRRIAQPSTRLWERRIGDDDALLLGLGRADVGWSPMLAGVGPSPSATGWSTEATQPSEVAAVLRRHARLASCPVAVDLAGGGVVGVVGPAAAARSLARSLVLEAVAHHGPADLQLVVVVDEAAGGDWRWAAWLPHCRDRGDCSGERWASGAGGHELLDGLVAAHRRAVDAARRRGDGWPGALAPSSARSGGTRPGRGTGGSGPGLSPVLLVVIDDEAMLTERRSSARAVLRGDAGPVAGIVLASSHDRLPATCTTVVCVDGDAGEASVRDVRTGEVVADVVVAGVTEPLARRSAQRLARHDDPEAGGEGAGLPERVGLGDVLAAELFTVEGLVGAWRRGDDAPSFAVPVGLADDGPFVLDLVGDGPHALVAGTTGAGKSELLRTWVAALAAHVGPDALNFVLIDYKGGSAFDECARLPHTVGLVTDLDESLGERALRCLEAELRQRERALRRAGAVDLAAQWARPGRHERLPRLVVVIDEFATLAAELPEFLDALVGIAQRGRSLGVHLVLATQRPSGAVNDHIRANTNLRMALRVQDTADSTDVVGSAAAATLPRRLPGRAVVRLGPGELIAVQTAYSGGCTASTDTAASVEVRPFEVGPFVGGRAGPAVAVSSPLVGRTDLGGDPPSDLRRLVDSARLAAEATGLVASRLPWPPPLPERLDLADLHVLATGAAGARPGEEGSPTAGADPDLVPFVLLDDPDHQRRIVDGWRPASGNLLVYGTVGAGTTTALLSVAAAIADERSPDDVHLYGIDFGSGELATIAGLPHCGAVVRAGEDERLRRLVRFLSREVVSRRSRSRSATGPGLRLVALVDGFRSLLAELEREQGSDLADQFLRFVLDGPEVGVNVVATAEHAAAMRHHVAASVSQRLVLRLADATEMRQLGAPAALPVVPGRGHHGWSGLTAQVASPGPFDAVINGAACRWPSVRRTPEPIGTLADVEIGALAHTAGAAGAVWTVPIGLKADDLRPATLRWHPGEGVLIAGPARSGRTTALAMLAEAIALVAPDAERYLLSGRRRRVDVPGLTEVDLPSSAAPSSAAAGPRRLGFDEFRQIAGEALAHGVPVCVLVDDADRVEDPEGHLGALVTAGARFVAAGRADALRSQFGHWARAVRASRIGLLLQPDTDLDGELLGVRLPRRAEVPIKAGRGYLVDGGDTFLVQVARGRSAPAGDQCTERT